MTLPATLPEVVAAVLDVLDDGAAWDEEDLLAKRAARQLAGLD